MSLPRRHHFFRVGLTTPGQNRQKCGSRPEAVNLGRRDEVTCIVCSLDRQVATEIPVFSEIREFQAANTPENPGGGTWDLTGCGREGKDR